MRVDPGAGVAVPVPDSTEPGAGFEQHRRESQRSQPVQLIQAREAGSDDHYVMIEPMWCRHGFVTPRATSAHAFKADGSFVQSRPPK